MSDSLPNDTAVTSPNTVALKQFGPYLGTREVAVQARLRLVEIVKAGKIATLDADTIAVMTPSFVDECVGGTFKELGEETFRERIEIKNVNESCELLIEAILERHAGPGSGLSSDDEDAVEAVSADKGEEE